AASDQAPRRPPLPLPLTAASDQAPRRPPLPLPLTAASDHFPGASSPRYVARPFATVRRTSPGSSMPSSGVFDEADASVAASTRHRAFGSNSTRSAVAPTSRPRSSPMMAAGRVDRAAISAASVIRPADTAA